MSGADDARALLEAVGGYVETPPGAAPPSQDRPVRLATVAPGYAGTGPVPVIFDGEALAGLRQYVPLAPVAAGQRVALLPVGATYVVLGRVDGPTIGSTAGPGFLELATDLEAKTGTDSTRALSPASHAAAHAGPPTTVFRVTQASAWNSPTASTWNHCVPAWNAPSVNTGFASWAGSILTVATAGWYWTNFMTTTNPMSNIGVAISGIIPDFWLGHGTSHGAWQYFGRLVYLDAGATLRMSVYGQTQVANTTWVVQRLPLG